MKRDAAQSGALTHVQRRRDSQISNYSGNSGFRGQQEYQKQAGRKGDERITANLSQISIKTVLLIQRMWRGFRDRYRVILLRKATAIKKKYFLEEEFWETLSKDHALNISSLLKVLQGSPRTMTSQQASPIQEHKYECSGARYVG